MWADQPTIALTGGSQTFAGAKSFSSNALTAGTLAVANAGTLGHAISKYTWTNAQVAALSGTTGNLLVCTLPANTLVKSALVIITGQAAGVTALTVALGRTSALYVDYIVASNAKAATNTIYGDATAELGTNLSALIGDLPSITATTDINLHFISSIENLSNVTGSTGSVYLETLTLP